MSENLHRRVYMASNNRNVSDIPREELEELVMEMQEELEQRKKRETQLRDQITIDKTRVKVAEISLKDQNLQFILPPSALRPSYAKNYAQPLTKQLDQDEEIGSDIATRENGEPNLTESPPRRYESNISGSYNPYQGANRRIVTLRQKIGDLQQEILDTDKDAQELHRELERLRKLLENRHCPKNEPFRHEKPIPKTKPKKKKITLKTCIDYCSDLLKEEKEPIPHDELLCVYYLLTKDDVLALELFGKLRAPDLSPDDIALLDDRLRDREAQLSILREQYRHLLARHEPLRDAFKDLKDRLPDHLIDNEEAANMLRNQIAELQKLIDGIPDLEKEIERLKELKAKLLKEKEDLFNEGARQLAEVDAEMRKVLSQISEDKAGVEREKRQLEEIDRRIRERYYTIAEELRRMKIDEAELRRRLDDMERKKKQMHDRLVLLQNAGLKSPMQVRSVDQLCREMLPVDLFNMRATMVDDCNKYLKLLRELKKECVRLKNSYSNKQQQQYAYEVRLKKAQHEAKKEKYIDYREDPTDF